MKKIIEKIKNWIERRKTKKAIQEFEASGEEVTIEQQVIEVKQEIPAVQEILEPIKPIEERKFRQIYRRYMISKKWLRPGKHNRSMLAKLRQAKYEAPPARLVQRAKDLMPADNR